MVLKTTLTIYLKIIIVCGEYEAITVRPSSCENNDKGNRKNFFYSYVCLLFEWAVPLAKLFLMWCMKILHSDENGSRKLEVNGPGHLPYYIGN